MIQALRERVGRIFGPRQERAAPIKLTPEYQGNYYGAGLGSSQPAPEDLLRENLGVADMATRAIANRIGSLNPQVKISRKDGSGTLVDEILDDHVLKFVLDRPHPDYTWQQIGRLTAQWIVAVGDAYWLKVNNGFGVPTMLQPVPPHLVRPVVRDSVVQRYVIRDALGGDNVFQRREIVRFWFPDPETLFSGEGYLGPNAVVADTQKFAGEHLRSRYQNDATPAMVLKGTADAVPPSDPQWERWQRDFARKYRSRGGSHAGLPSMTPPGWEPVFAAMQSGADITPLLEHLQANMLMNMGVPASVLGRVISGDRSSAETNQFVFDEHTIMPIAQMIQQALTYQLAVDFDEALFVEFEGFVSEDKDYRLRREDQDLRLKVKSIQQILEDRGEDPEAAPWGELPVGSIADQPYTGDVYEDEGPPPLDDEGALFEPEEDSTTEAPEDAEDQTNPATAGKANSQNAASRRSSGARGRGVRARSLPDRRSYFAPAAEAARVARRERDFRPRFSRALRSIFDAQRRDVIKRFRALTENRSRAAIAVEDLFTPEEWSKLFRLRVEPIREAAYLNSAEQALAGLVSGQEFDFNATVIQNLREANLALIKHTNRTTQERLRKALIKSAEEGEGPDAIAKRLNEAFRYRRNNATTIARTELLKSTQDAQIESYKQSGVVEYKAWNDNEDLDVRPEHRGAKIKNVKLGESFTLADGVTRARFPGDPELPVGQIANCRCFVTPEFEDPEEVN